MATTRQNPIRFGAFSLDMETKELRYRHEFLSVPPKELDLLILLASHAGRVLDKRQLMDAIWPGVHVEEGNLARHVSFLRQRLAAFEPASDYIETIPKRGYRFRAGPVPGGAAQPSHVMARKMLVVLPFENLSGDPAKDYFSDGFTEEIITNLSRWNSERLGVIARTSAMRYKRTEKTIREIGAELEVSHVLEGSIRWDANRVRVTAQLIQVHDQTHLWAETYDRKLSDVFAVQSEVTSAIAREIQVKLGPAKVRSSKKEIAPAAYDAYLRGRHFWLLRTEDGMRRGIELFAEALRMEPDFAAAFAGIADSHVMLACRGICPMTESFRHARAAARRALALDPELGEAHATLAHLRLHERDWDGLDDAFQGAILRNPSLGIAYYWYGEYLMAMGRRDEAVAMTERGLQVDPLSPVIGAAFAEMLYFAHDFQRARAVLERTSELHPEHFIPQLKLSLVYVQLGKHAQALETARRAIELSQGSTETISALGLVYAAAGDRKNMEATVRELKQHDRRRYVLPYNIAKIYAAAGDPDQAFAWLETALREGNCDIIELPSEPAFDSLHNDPRYRPLLQRIGL